MTSEPFIFLKNHENGLELCIPNPTMNEWMNLLPNSNTNTKYKYKFKYKYKYIT